MGGSKKLQLWILQQGVQHHEIKPYLSLKRWAKVQDCTLGPPWGIAGPSPVLFLVCESVGARGTQMHTAPSLRSGAARRELEPGSCPSLPLALALALLKL